MEKPEFVIVVLCFLVAISTALECGVGRNADENLRNVLSQCVKDNQTLNKIWDMASSASSESESDSSSTSKESSSVPIMKGKNLQAGSTTKMSKSDTKQNSRLKRSPRTSSNKQLTNGQKTGNSNWQQQRTQEQSTTAASTEEERGEESSPSPTTKESSQEQENGSNTGNSVNDGVSDQCVLQCVFDKLDMTDSNGFPDHKKFVNGLLKTASGRELRVFLQESTDECFQQMENENIDDSCLFSTKLITCLAEKGRSNCSDWPTGNLPF